MLSILAYIFFYAVYAFTGYCTLIKPLLFSTDPPRNSPYRKTSTQKPSDTDIWQGKRPVYEWLPGPSACAAIHFRAFNWFTVNIKEPNRSCRYKDSHGLWLTSSSIQLLVGPHKLQNAKTLLLTHHTCLQGKVSPHQAGCSPGAMFHESVVPRWTLVAWLAFMDVAKSIWSCFNNIPIKELGN